MASFSASLNFQRSAFENAVRYPHILQFVGNNSGNVHSFLQ